MAGVIMLMNKTELKILHEDLKKALVATATSAQTSWFKMCQLAENTPKEFKVSAKADYEEALKTLREQGMSNQASTDSLATARKYMGAINKALDFGATVLAGQSIATVTKNGKPEVEPATDDSASKAEAELKENREFNIPEEGEERRAKARLGNMEAQAVALLDTFKGDWPALEKYLTALKARLASVPKT